MNLPLARRLASDGLSLKDAAKRMGVSAFRLGVAADKHGIHFAAVTRRPADWGRPESDDPEVQRQYWTGQVRNATWGRRGFD
jgi:hypothetical protein